ncbi:hypothetical protein H5410_060419 [Solanum commersonii]|uniref:Uncharacterized protein n=1 Tax=Solanum commersonii TaxID=4109 RepID=A0A9J5W514_SOLCO|nr:hypothetical protein H5410_060419 [Solanum commersonii]
MRSETSEDMPEAQPYEEESPVDALKKAKDFLAKLKDKINSVKLFWNNFDRNNKVYDLVTTRMRPSWPPSQRGKGRNAARGGKGHILIQHGNKKLISANISGGSSSSSGTSGIDINHPMYKKFLDFIKSKKEGENATPSYSAILTDDENTKVFDLKDKK